MIKSGILFGSVMAFLCGLASPAFSQSFYVGLNNGQINLVHQDGTSTPFGNVTAPEGMIVDSFGNLFVADSTANVVYKFTPGGTRTVFASLSGSPSPSDVAKDSSGKIYIAETGNNRITQYAPDGTFLGVYVDGEAGPEALTFDQNDFLFVGSNAANEIAKYPPGGGPPSGAD
jgi:sugar lactone lactonase YvrE